MAEYEQAGKSVVKTLTSQSIFANAATRSFLSANSQDFLVFSGTGAVDDAGFSFQIPEDYKGNLQFCYVWCMDGTGTGQGRLAFNIVQSTDLGKTFITDPDEVIEILDSGQDVAAWKIQISPLIASSLTWQPGECCIVEIERDPGHSNDTMADTLYLAYILIKYDK